MEKRRIYYEIDVDFPPGTLEPVITLWADGIARGIEHNKPEVKHVEYVVQVRSIDHERQPPEIPPAPETEQVERERLGLPQPDPED